MKSPEAKTRVMQYLLWDKNYHAAFTESLGNSDVFGINRSFYTTEIEIKTSREDLLNELYTIECVITKDNGMMSKLRQRNTKYFKHGSYLGNSYIPGDFRPNKFYFAIPEELVDHRLHTLDKTPYGVLVIRNPISTPPAPQSHYFIEVYREATKIHKDKIKPEIMIKLLRKATTENLILREKMYLPVVEHAENIA